MSDVEISKPVLIALIGAIVLAAFVLLRPGPEEEPPLPPTPISQATGSTGAGGDASKTDDSAKPQPAAEKNSKQDDEPADDKKSARQKLIEEAKAAGMPTPVYDAVQKGKIVMIFFWEPKAKDDERVNDSIDNLQAYRGNSLVVFREKIANKSKYDGIAQAAELTQTPGIVILYKDEADTAQGYIDSAALNTRITRLTGNSGSD